MNLVLFAVSGLYDRSPGKIVEMIRRFGFTRSVIAFLLIGVTNTCAAQSQQSGAVTVSQAVQDAVRKNLNLLAERYSVAVAVARGRCSPTCA
jgi:hypothetical protein